MNILLWVILGLVAGWLGSIIMNTNSSQGVLMDILMGILGAVLGGWLMSLAGFGGVSGFDIWSLFVATLGAVILIAIGKTLRRQSTV